MLVITNQPLSPASTNLWSRIYKRPVSVAPWNNHLIALEVPMAMKTTCKVLAGLIDILVAKRQPSKSGRHRPGCNVSTKRIRRALRDNSTRKCRIFRLGLLFPQGNSDKTEISSERGRFRTLQRYRSCLLNGGRRNAW